MAKKVLHIINGLGRGGAEIVLIRLINHWDNSDGDEHVVLALRDNCVFDLDEINARIVAFDLKYSNQKFIDTLRIFNFIRSERPDVVFAWMYYGCIFSAMAGLLRVPVLWGIHHSLHNISKEPWSSKLNILVCSWLSRLWFIKKIIYVSETSEAHHNKFGYSPKKSCVIPNGVDCEVFVPCSRKRSEMRGKLGIPDSAYVIGSFSRFDPIKNHELLIASYKKILESDANAYLLLAGDGISEDNPAIMDIIGSVKWNTRLKLLGRCDEMDKLYSAIDIYLLTSRSESFPNVICEAMACGVPCVSTNVGAVSIIIGENGWVVDSSDPVKIADAIKCHRKMSKRDREAMSSSARDSILLRFQIGKVVEKYTEIVDRVSGLGLM